MTNVLNNLCPWCKKPVLNHAAIKRASVVETRLAFIRIQVSQLLERLPVSNREDVSTALESVLRATETKDLPC